MKSTNTDQNKFEAELEEWEFQNAQALKIINQSVGTTHRTAIQSYRTASMCYETLKLRYGLKDVALLAQLLSQLFAIQSLKQIAVTEKYDLIVNLTAQISDQEPEAIISDIAQAVILMKSLSSDYDTTLKILIN